MSLTEQQDPMSTFLYALKAPESRRQYPRRFKMFLDFLKLEGRIGEQAMEFLTKARQKPQWAQDNLMQFIAFQIQRAIRKEIAESTISNSSNIIASYRISIWYSIASTSSFCTSSNCKSRY